MTQVTRKENIFLGGIEVLEKLDTYIAIQYTTGEKARLYILNSHVFRYYMSPTGDFTDYPVPNDPGDVAKINIKQMDDYDPKAFLKCTVSETDNNYVANTGKIEIRFDKIKGTMSVYDKRTNNVVFYEFEPLSYASCETTQTVYQHKDEYFFGGGMQNGRFTHKGEMIEIVNTNNWIDGGVTSPCPFYWTTYGYGVLRNTWKPGFYDFGIQRSEVVETSHQEQRFDAFFFINTLPNNILSDYYELTGRPIFMPEYAYYEAHLNAFNRDYWVKVDAGTPRAILFEDGYYYKSYQPKDIEDKDKGILESLNGEKNNYQFSARAMIDRYKRHDIPLGWFVPNDGYGSGYGQTDSLDGDIENLKEFANYSRSNGVEVALWTESQLEPKDPESPKKGERDLRKEVGVAGVVALKCDVAWIGSGYSFGLTEVENAADIFVNVTKHNVRPMVIMVDGWAGTQRYSGIWSGDQTGGQWEYIRFHIPTYIGTGLSGQPIVGSDMDGIYGGKQKEVNIRDFQWKAFTPLQLNMDGWGNIPKTPFSFDDQATNINRAYLKLKSMLLPYNYTIGHESSVGLPMIRAMFLEFPNEVLAYTKDSQYQFMWGPNILVAPIYNDECIGEDSLRHGIYLPDSNQIWIDLLTGEKYMGGIILNYVKVPLWKIPIFIKDGSIIPLTNPNNNPNEIKRDVRIFNVYPNGESKFEVYEDDGISSDYLDGKFATSKITVIGPQSNEHGNLFINIDKVKGRYKNMVTVKCTIIQIMTSDDVHQIKAAMNGDSIELNRVETDEAFEKKENVFFFKKDYAINPYLNNLAGEVLKQQFLLIKIQKMDVTSSHIQIKVNDYTNKSKVFGGNNKYKYTIKTPRIILDKLTPTSIALKWNKKDEAIYYEIERDGALFSNIMETGFEFKGFKYESQHVFRIRTVTDEGVSEWSDFITITTKQDPHRYVIKRVKVSCNMPCQPCQEICNLTDGKMSSLWHTHWGEPGQSNPTEGYFLKLYFDLCNVYSIDKIEYIPHEDAGNGTFLQIEYRFSIDGKDWSPMSEVIHWKYDETAKIITMNGTKMRYMELHVLNSVGRFGSGKQMLFYRKP